MDPDHAKSTIFQVGVRSNAVLLEHGKRPSRFILFVNQNALQLCFSAQVRLSRLDGRTHMSANARRLLFSPSVTGSI